MAFSFSVFSDKPHAKNECAIMPAGIASHALDIQSISSCLLGDFLLPLAVLSSVDENQTAQWSRMRDLNDLLIETSTG